jgi:acetolactate synthase small subunit
VKHTISVLLEDKPGALARIATMFARRGFNIDSLAVGPTEHDEVSRMTIVVNVEESPLEQVTKQLNKLIEVIKIVELDGSSAINRELLLVKVKADPDTVVRSSTRSSSSAPRWSTSPPTRSPSRPSATSTSWPTCCGSWSRSASGSSCSPAWSRSVAAPVPSPSAACARFQCRLRRRPAESAPPAAG